VQEEDEKQEEGSTRKDQEITTGPETVDAGSAKLTSISSRDECAEEQ